MKITIHPERRAFVRNTLAWWAGLSFLPSILLSSCHKHESHTPPLATGTIQGGDLDHAIIELSQINPAHAGMITALGNIALNNAISALVIDLSTEFENSIELVSKEGNVSTYKTQIIKPDDTNVSGEIKITEYAHTLDIVVTIGNTSAQMTVVKVQAAIFPAQAPSIDTAKTMSIAFPIVIVIVISMLLALIILAILTKSCTARRGRSHFTITPSAWPPFMKITFECDPITGAT